MKLAGLGEITFNAVIHVNRHVESRLTIRVAKAWQCASQFIYHLVVVIVDLLIFVIDISEPHPNSMATQFVATLSSTPKTVTMTCYSTLT